MAQAKWEKMMKRAEPNQYNESWFGDILRNEDLNQEIVRNYDWMIENVGAKWAHIDDMDEVMMTGYSAWGHPEQGIINILRILSQYDPEMVTEVRYEDEMPNFFGVQVYRGFELVEASEYDSDEIQDMMFETVEGLRDEWDEEEDELTESGNELWFENLFDVMNNTQDRDIDAIYESMKEDI